MSGLSSALRLNLTAGALLADYAACIDADRLEAWPDFFTEDAHYRITSAFNYSRDLPVGVVQADNRRMLEDRVAALRKANVYEPHGYRHIVSAVRVLGETDGLIEAEAGFLVVRTMQDGAQDLFASGRYVDRICLAGERPRFKRKVVVLDSDRIDTLLVIPL